MNEARQMVDVMRTIIHQNEEMQSRVAVGRIIARNDDGTYKVNILPDTNNIISVHSESLYDLKGGDDVYLYLINNRLSNAFILAKCGGGSHIYGEELRELRQNFEEYQQETNNKINFLLDEIKKLKNA